PLEAQVDDSSVHVVVHEGAHALGAVDEREPQHRDIPPLPERVAELAADEREVERLDAFAEHEVHEEVAENEHDEDDASHSHLCPAPLLPVDAAATRRPGGGSRGGALWCRHVAYSLKTLIKWRGVKASMRMSYRTMTIQKSSRWCF